MKQVTTPTVAELREQREKSAEVSQNAKLLSVEINYVYGIVSNDKESSDVRNERKFIESRRLSNHMHLLRVQLRGVPENSARYVMAGGGEGVMCLL